MATTILLVDDHKIMRNGINAILRSSGEFQTVGEGESGSQAIRLYQRLRPDIVLMDISLPDLDGIETTTELRRVDPDAKVVVLSMYDDTHSVMGAIRAGARGFVVKKASEDDLLDALRAVAKGGSYFSPEISDCLLSCVKRGDQTGHADARLDVLSSRELQVLRLISEGKSSKDIASMLELSVETVRSYRKSMMSKLAVKNIAGLTRLALACGVTHSPMLELTPRRDRM